MKVLIVGGGIGGLCTALELERVGIEPLVFESVHEVQPLGVGINLLPHAMKNLAGLGLLDALLATGIQTRDLGYYNKFGQRIWQEPRGRAAGYRLPQVSIHRGELQLLLLRAARDRLGDRIRCGHHLADFRETADGRIVATFVDRKSGAKVAEEEGDVLIAADGIHSTVRHRFYPDEGAARWNGVLFWRAASEAPPFLSGRSMIMAGHPHQKFIAYPMSRAHEERGSALVNWAAELHFDPSGGFPREDWNRRGRIEDFLPRFEDWVFPWLDIPDLIRRTEAVFEFPCVDRDPLERWTFGRATLLGDAAHPMRPMGSNGASQAIRDARAIADALSTRAGIDEALAAYEGERRPATTAIVLSNRLSGPEQVMAIVEDRAPQGFDNLHTVISEEELREIADAYKRTAGFDVQSVNEGVAA